MMSLVSCRIRVGCAVALLSMLAGCGGGGSKAPENRVSVSGTITLDGMPLTFAAVSFLPETPKSGTGGFGATDESGKYTLKWHGTDEGVPPGKYKVVISRMSQKDGSPIPAGQSAADVGAVESLPLRYSDPTASELTGEVTTADKPIDFMLVGAKKKK